MLIAPALCSMPSRCSTAAKSSASPTDTLGEGSGNAEKDDGAPCPLWTLGLEMVKASSLSDRGDVSVRPCAGRLDKLADPIDVDVDADADDERDGAPAPAGGAGILTEEDAAVVLAVAIVTAVVGGLPPLSTAAVLDIDAASEAANAEMLCMAVDVFVDVDNDDDPPEEEEEEKEEEEKEEEEEEGDDDDPAVGFALEDA